MADRKGIAGKALSALGNPKGAVPFVYSAAMTSNTSTTMGPEQAEFPFRVILAWGFMTAAGTSSDTVVLQKVSGGTTSAITNTADLSAFSDTDQFDLSQIDNANYRIGKGDKLQATAAGGAQCEVYALCVRVA